MLSEILERTSHRISFLSEYNQAMNKRTYDVGHVEYAASPIESVTNEIQVFVHSLNSCITSDHGQPNSSVLKLINELEHSLASKESGFHESVTGSWVTMGTKFDTTAVTRKEWGQLTRCSLCRMSVVDTR